ncbi:hypothetical protein Hanom_Chr11g00973851 [Helianthus anomalus]
MFCLWKACGVYKGNLWGLGMECSRTCRLSYGTCKLKILAFMNHFDTFSFEIWLNQITMYGTDGEWREPPARTRYFEGHIFL